MRIELCPGCEQDLVKQHLNARWCAGCAEKYRRQPRHSLTPAQVRRALQLRTKVSKEEIAQRLGVSRSAVMRLGQERGLTFSVGYKGKPAMVAQVTAYYAKHGRAKTEKRFPDVSVRSIVERYPHAPRQTRWTDEQIIAAARMAGLVSPTRQARIFKRPRANAGSIKSLWTKRFKQAGGGIHGLKKNVAKEILRPGFPTIVTEWWALSDGSTGPKGQRREMVLWCDMEPWLQRGLPRFIRDGVRAMAQFQRWLYRTDDPRMAILQLLKQGRRH